MVYENSEKKAIYTVFEGDIADLAERVTGFCRDEYGERCEFYEVSVERQGRGGYWKIHEFSSFDDRATRAVENHLKAQRDFVRLRFGGSDRDYELDFIICSPENTEQLARYVEKERLESFDRDAMVVLCVERKAVEIQQEQRRLLENLEQK